MINPYIFLFLILFFILYKIFNNLLIDIDTKKSYTIGILKSEDDHQVIIKEMIELCTNDYTIKYFTTQNSILEALNNNNIQFSIVYDDELIDGTLGLNSYKNKLENIQFITGLFYNHYYFMTNSFYKTKNRTQKIDNIEDIANFYSVNNRNIIIGTEISNSVSHMNLIRILHINGLKPINITTINTLDNTKINKNIVYYYTSTFEDISCKFMNNVLDALFVVKMNENNTIKHIIDNKDILFLDINFNNTIFNDLFSQYYYNKTITISGGETSFDTQYIIKTTSMRAVLATNSYTPDDPIKELITCYYTHNNMIINKLMGTGTHGNHGLFKPIDMFYMNGYIPINDTAIQYYKTLGFIINPDFKKMLENKKIIEKQHLKKYWKYDKIGLQTFKI